MEFWILSDIDSAKFLAIKKMVQKFNIEYPRIKVRLLIKTRQSMWESMFLYLRNPKQYPLADLLEIPHSWTKVLVNLEILREMKSIADIDAEDFFDFLKDGMALKPKGDYFSLPWWLELYTLSVREDMLRLIGNAAEKLAVWEGFVDVCRFLKSKNRKSNFYPLENSNPSGAFSLYDVLPCIWNRGGRLFNDEFTKCEASKVEVLRGIQDFIFLARKGYLPLFKENYYEEKGLLSEGRRAMILSGRLPSCYRKTHAPKLVSFIYPNINRDGHFASSVNLAVTVRARENETSRFLRFLFLQANLKFLAESFNVFPCMKKSAEYIYEQKRFSVYKTILSKPRMTPDIEIFPTYEFLMNNLLKEMAIKVAAGAWDEDDLQRKLIIVQTEVDYILSSY